MALRDSLRHNNAAAFSSVHIVAVAINTDLREGLAYLDSIGFEHFDQVSVGDGWQNQHVVRLIWRDHVAEPEAPQVILVTRAMNARIDPVELTFTPDSVIGAVSGYRALLSWVDAGAHLDRVGPSITRASATR